MVLLKTARLLAGSTEWGKVTLTMLRPSRRLVTLSEFWVMTESDRSSTFSWTGRRATTTLIPPRVLTKVYLASSFVWWPTLLGPIPLPSSTTSISFWFGSFKRELLGTSWTIGFSCLCSIRWFLIVPKQRLFFNVFQPMDNWSTIVFKLNRKKETGF